jgi:hypothetical protein
MKRQAKIKYHKGFLGSLVFCLAASGCGGSMKNARSMTKAEKQIIVSRPAPDRVPIIDGLDSVGSRVRISAPPSKVWQVLAVGFGELDNWAGSAVSESKCTSGSHGKLGAVRSCKIADHMPMIGGDYYEEKITAWDPAQGYFSVLQTKSTGPTEILINENWISSDGEGGTVVTSIVHVDFDLMPRLMGADSKFKRKLVEGHIGLKHFCETGEKVTTKNWKQVVKMYPQILKDNKV